MFHPPSSSSFPPHQLSDFPVFPPPPQPAFLSADTSHPRFFVNDRPLQLPLNQIIPRADSFVRQDQNHSTIPGDFLDFPPFYNP